MSAVPAATGSRRTPPGNNQRGLWVVKIMMVKTNTRGGTLLPLIMCFVAMVVLLAPGLWLAKYIGGWAWPADTAFWAALVVTCTWIGRHRGRS